jgi:hypothetical protein
MGPYECQYPLGSGACAAGDTIDSTQLARSVVGTGPQGLVPVRRPDGAGEPRGAAPTPARAPAALPARARWARADAAGRGQAPERRGALGLAWSCAVSSGRGSIGGPKMYWGLCGTVPGILRGVKTVIRCASPVRRCARWTSPPRGTAALGTPDTPVRRAGVRTRDRKSGTSVARTASSTRSRRAGHRIADTGPLPFFRVIRFFRHT